jgi:hypothetical protein
MKIELFFENSPFVFKFFKETNLFVSLLIIKLLFSQVIYIRFFGWYFDIQKKTDITLHYPVFTKFYYSIFSVGIKEF